MGGEKEEEERREVVFEWEVENGQDLFGLLLLALGTQTSKNSALVARRLGTERANKRCSK